MIVIIDYGLGNLGSVKNALDKLGVDSMVSKSVKDIEKATGLVLPGVGSATEGMKNLRKSGLNKVILKQIKLKKPILGICLGMQLLFFLSEEGNTECLNVIEGKVKKFNNKLKVPQIGWNQVKQKPSKLFLGIKDKSYFYFVHSYYCQASEEKIIIGSTEYGINFTSAIEDKNIFGVQFHPEKSGENGLKLLKNFVDIVYANNTGN
ncbi:imidazole glycerol phosphate synthase subunit HisH [Candidatus Roizmanbacteria bacterium CG01_land_8_20_14_3_00_33_9]|uniref:Imidazole glycerol phosphate synthase subunit HisH n=1 Tax=Candidatus Roizmanbacteria bacterium CG01_land_8_20_14_3_00_33_9 TaxID=1974843 RepID=A0A2M7E550_9BACT|nr:MAG: imidazole glycerol phosphate synthase subunit HisH [Candidatus Roizmanbacteria bacterium CG01_land_8_20_14_3_00_33_9]